ncbi:MAG: hypothetical protein H0X51_03455 [Parachlamydiaceae bacterium]|nr:hypothetical protein [Parachlamydiaceae bacterium]
MTKCCGFDPLPIPVPETRYDPAYSRLGLPSIHSEKKEKISRCVRFLQGIVHLIVGLWMKCCSAHYVKDNLHRMTSGNLTHLKPSQLRLLKDMPLKQNERLTTTGQAICTLFLSLFESEWNYDHLMIRDPKPESKRLAGKLLDALSLTQIESLHKTMEATKHSSHGNTPHRVIADYLLTHPGRAAENNQLFSDLLSAYFFQPMKLTQNERTVLYRHLPMHRLTDLFNSVIRDISYMETPNLQEGRAYLSQIVTTCVTKEKNEKSYELQYLFRSVARALAGEQQNIFRQIFDIKHLEALAEHNIHDLFELIPDNITPNNVEYVVEIFTIWGSKLRDASFAKTAKETLLFDYTTGHRQRDLKLVLDNCKKLDSVSLKTDAEVGRKFIFETLTKGTLSP